jgi:signal transduction histidine kinase/ligand-binding sensor domain-containing protein
MTIRFWLGPLGRAATVLLLACLLRQPAALALESGVALTQYSHRVWRVGDANLLGTPQGIAQTTDGYMWISTSNGLFRFDGVHFSKWTAIAGEALPSNSMWHLFGARDGSLYGGTDAGLFRITSGHVQSYPGSPRWPGPFLQDANGEVWMGVSAVHSLPQTLCRIRAGSLTCLGTPDGFACSRGVAGAKDLAGNIWIGSPEGTCTWHPGSRPQTATLTTFHDVDAGPIKALAVTTDGTVWAGTAGDGKTSGLQRYSAGQWNPFGTSAADQRIASVSTLLASRSGALWIGTSTEGLYRLENGHLEHFDLAEGLSDRNILSVFEGREGGVWVVTPAAVEYFRDYAVLSMTSREGSIVGHAQAVAADRNGNVFLGSNILVRVHGSAREPVRYADGTDVDDIRTLYVDSRETLWIATRDRLLLRDVQGRLASVRGYARDVGNYVDYITEDRNQDVWASVRNVRSNLSSLVRLHDSQVAAQFPVTGPLAGQVANALAPNPAGGLWVGGSAQGLFWFHDGRFERDRVGNVDSRVENLLQEPEGPLWVVTVNGFICHGDGRSRTLDSNSGLPCAGGVNIIDDGRGYKWFFMHCGVLRVSEAQISAWWQNSTAAVTGRFFGPPEGARPNLSNGSPAKTPDGHLWAASDYSFEVVDTLHLPFNSTPPGVQVERVAADGREFPPGQVLTLPVNTRQVELDYTGLSYRVPEQVRFRYHLQGYDPGWNDAGTRRQAFYNDLAAGSYTFHVLASNNDGVWSSAAAAVTFTILPAWHRTWVFRVFMLGTSVALLLLIYFLRLRYYAESLKQRFDERLRERTRLARDLHDTLLQTIQGSKMVADDALEHLEDPRLTGRSLDRLSDWLDRASAEGRVALEALRTQTLDSNDLAGSLRRVAEDCYSGKQVKITVVTKGSLRELHPIARDELYRIAYEAIRNASAHSAATQLWIEISYRANFQLDIRDNGRGMAQAFLLHGRPGHYGLAGMQERADSVGARLDIRSSSDGTTVSVIIPGRGVYEDAYGWRARVLDTFLVRNSER